ncbi:VanZ family protein [Bacillus sp. FJAT-26390]|uniref:VanZ family protein n=1 Tax=Bacillus sp. FJAT-26390 TaxID=1743142 RepID=UPI0009E3936E|nr:VanZ family protein [Bacillus sp. FJAT-26390]
MYQGNLRKMTLILLALYTALTLYFMFIGFNRTASVVDSGLRYSLTPEGIPLHFPTGRYFNQWLFEFGNFAAFIPFGIIIPLLYRLRFIQFIALFVLSITILEVLQMVTRLGSFDIDDIIINSIGASVGFCAQRFISRDREKLKGIRKIILTAMILSVGTIALFGGINKYIDEETDNVIALNELTQKEGAVLWDKSLSGFTINHNQFAPQVNLYSSTNARTNEFTYPLNKKYAKITAYAAIPDDLFNKGSQGESIIAFSINGKEVYSVGFSANSSENQLWSFEVPLIGADELTVTITNDDPNPDTNVIMWDITLSELNTMQKITKNIKEIVKPLF